MAGEEETAAALRDEVEAGLVDVREVVVFFMERNGENKCAQGKRADIIRIDLAKCKEEQGKTWGFPLDEITRLKSRRFLPSSWEGNPAWDDAKINRKDTVSQPPQQAH